ncbi:nose resistant to fluoxetine protein 6-like [Daphnia pulicaria]|uniref:nose resistant to fluoxetine protein 6-like n=1 Tax=Daphnia pulicaria TaxID=35523 RepID=UPI001EECA5A2|nr:nose resistant to fluoxetine protein 6-like [Daphnia pulicaria]
MRTPLFLSSKPLTKVLLFNFFIPVIFNVQHIYCLELSTSSVEKGIPHQPDWLIQTSSPNALPSKISETCLDHTEQYLKALRNRQLWAVKMYQSSGRLAEHLIHTGSGYVHHDLGFFDECVSIYPSDVPFQGQYCTVFFDLTPVSRRQNYEKQNPAIDQSIKSDKEGEPKNHISNFLMPSIGFCLPSTCSARELRYAVAQRIGYRLIENVNFSLVAITNENYCYTNNKLSAHCIKFDNMAIGALTGFGLLGIIVLIATIHEKWNYSDESVHSQKIFPVQLLHCFSAHTNCRTLFSTQDDVKDSLACLHGIRVLTTCWIVLIHAAGEFIQRMSYTRNMDLKNATRWEFQIITNGLFAVDTFLLISGMLVAFTQMRQLDHTNGLFNIKRFYFRRFARLTPVYASVLVFIATLWPYVGTGPDWNYVQQMSQTFRQNLWANLLYINNYVTVADQRSSLSNPSTGMIESWYLACDMQMFWVSPVFVYPIWRWKKTGLIWTSVSLLIFLVMSTVPFVVHDIPPTVLFSRPSAMLKLNEYCRKHYHHTIARIPPYIIGILLGWYLHKIKDTKINLNKYLAVAGWITAILLGFTVIYGMFPYLDEAKTPVINPVIHVLYGAFHRSAWSLTVGWVIFACTQGYGGCIEMFLSSKVFLPLSRLSYAVYLVHFTFIKSYVSHMRQPIYLTEYYFFTVYLGILLIVFTIASVVSVVVEQPFLNADKLLFPSNSKNPSETKKKM